MPIPSPTISPSNSQSQDTTIPVIDLTNPTPSTPQEILDAASTHGFLFIKNDDLTIPPADIAAMFALSHAFFTSPEPTKSAYKIHTPEAGGVNRGWVSLSGEALDPSGTAHGDPKEAFNIGPATHPSLMQPLPPSLEASKDLISRFQSTCHALCTKILTHLTSALEIPDPTYLAARHDQSKGPCGSIFRLLYYPATASISTTPSIRAGAHSDYGSLTLLFRRPGEAGLQLRTPQGTWIPVPVNPAPSTLTHAPILVNIGDLLSFWTGGLLKSTVHRVAFGDGGERYSIAYFCHPRDEVRLERVPGRVVQGVGEEGRAELERQRARLGLLGDGEDDGVLTAREHLERRLKVTYGL